MGFPRDGWAGSCWQAQNLALMPDSNSIFRQPGPATHWLDFCHNIGWADTSSPIIFSIRVKNMKAEGSKS